MNQGTEIGLVLNVPSMPEESTEDWELHVPSMRIFNNARSKAIRCSPKMLRKSIYVMPYSLLLNSSPCMTSVVWVCTGSSALCSHSDLIAFALCQLL